MWRKNKSAYFTALPGKPPKYEKSASRVSKTTLLELEEFKRGFWRRAGELACEEVFKDEAKKAVLQASIQFLIIENMKKIMKQESE